MKKLLIAFIATTLFVPQQSSILTSDYTITAFAQSSSYGYMKCQSSCLFFKTSDITDMSTSNIYFIIPEGYFVRKIKDISSTTIEVSYMNKTGFVMSERVREVDFLPEVKYLQNITFNISSYSGTQLWSIPSTQDTSKVLVKLIPAGTKNLTYIADVHGEIPSGCTSSIWYYCHYSPISDPTSVFEGYIHSEKTTSLSPIPENLEGKITETTEENSPNNQSGVTLSKSVEIILIALIALPILIIFVLLFLSGIRKEKAANNAANETNKSNYHEIDNNPISRTNNDTKKNMNYLKDKKFSLKKRFENFMFSEDINNEIPKEKVIAFDSLDDEDDDLL